MAPEAAAGLLRALGGDARVELAAALDDWAYVRSGARYLSRPGDLDDLYRGTAAGWSSRISPRRPPGDLDDLYRGTAPLLRVTRLLDPDPVRNRLRDAVAAADRPAVGR